jgi:hypothetical protein
VSRSLLLELDAAINLAVGALLVAFPSRFMAFLGVPIPESAFYPSILGAVLVGIGLALIMGVRDIPDRGGGLGLLGAIAINLCAAAVLLLWLVFGRLGLPVPAPAPGASAAGLTETGRAASLLAVSLALHRLRRSARATARRGSCARR